MAAAITVFPVTQMLSSSFPSDNKFSFAFTVGAKLKLEIIETTQGNLLKSLDADLYDCVISMVGIDEWNSEKYAATNVYCDVSGLEDVLEEMPDSTQIAVFGKKGSKLIPMIETQALEPLKKEGTLSEISQRLLGRDIIVEE